MGRSIALLLFDALCTYACTYTEHIHTYVGFPTTYGRSLGYVADYRPDKSLRCPLSTYICKYNTLCCMALVNDHTNIHGIQDSVHTVRMYVQ